MMDTHPEDQDPQPEQPGSTAGAEMAREAEQDAPDASDSGTVAADVSLEDLQAQLTEAKSAAEEYLDGWQRSRAEFANYKARVKREEQEAYAAAAASLLARVLPVVDDLERALRDRPREGEASVWADGVELIYRKLKTLLESEGVEVIPTADMPFDPNLHEALSHEDSPDHPEGHVIDVVVPGYRMGERVLRPALVRVAK
jgi:molecular chaperone GrpE